MDLCKAQSECVAAKIKWQNRKWRKRTEEINAEWVTVETKYGGIKSEKQFMDQATGAGVRQRKREGEGGREKREREEENKNAEVREEWENANRPEMVYKWVKCHE